MFSDFKNISKISQSGVAMTRNFDQYFLDCIAKITINSQYNFFGRIFVTVLLVEIFNFIGYASNTTCDITIKKASFI